MKHRRLGGIIFTLLVASCSPVRGPAPEPPPASGVEQVAGYLLPANEAPYWFTWDTVIQDTCPSMVRSATPADTLPPSIRFNRMQLSDIPAPVELSLGSDGRMLHLATVQRETGSAAITMLTLSPSGHAVLSISLLAGTAECRTAWSGHWV